MFTATEIAGLLVAGVVECVAMGRWQLNRRCARTVRKIAQGLLEAARRLDGEKYVLMHCAPGALDALHNELGRNEYE